ncbi:hypothetical protein OCK02_19355 [Rhizobium sp. TRM96647]|uniref:hypothetical protein n=1 Tax=unclassified Rhizobium TaxID=2613769 RepID=UPI0021E8C8C0|nr:MULTISPECIES: hypothetical protein [unclassified Rhizobium]MCV3738367.1 hypothetical protein [Rhizobium sp. TRM96647]MCV3759884.1 hypothetical protein [Rhizobium sp. TRM96650]
MTEDEEREFDALAARLNEINREVASYVPSFRQAGGGMAQARADAATWLGVLDPLFEEHARVVDRLRELSSK